MFLTNWWILACSLGESDDSCSKFYHRPLEWFSKSSFIRSFQIGREVFGISQMAIAFHRVRPPPFIQSWFVAIVLKYILPLVERLFQQCHFSPIDEVLKCGVSMINLHILSQMPSSCRFLQLSVCATAPRIFTNFSPSHGKSPIYTEKTDSTEWRELVPRQRIGDCSEIHVLRWGLCCCQVTILFCSQNRSLLVFAEVSHEHYASVFLCLHFWSITFRIWVLSFRGMCERIHLQVLQINCEGL